MSILLQALIQLQLQACTVQSNVKLSDIRVGSKVVVKGGFGSETPLTVLVEGVDPDIKNGRAGIDYTDTQGGRWAYLDQVVRVVEY